MGFPLLILVVYGRFNVLLGPNVNS